MNQNVIDPPRPRIVTALAALLLVAATLLLLSAIGDLVLVSRAGENQQLFGEPVSDTFWIVSATSAVFMALVYLWVSRSVFDGNPLGHMLVNVVAAINLIFALLKVADGSGIAEVLINLVILVLNNTKTSRSWFDTF